MFGLTNVGIKIKTHTEDVFLAEKIIWTRGGSNTRLEKNASEELQNLHYTPNRRAMYYGM
jgi:hypothetical protein